MSEEKGVVKYQARDGQEVTLSFQNVKQYLVSGNKEAVTNQELMYFLGVCKSRGLNPFKKDAYLIKYGSDPAAIITSIDYFRSRAKAQPDCVGWKKGIIIQNGDGTLKDSAGIILEGETLVGGFFEAQPEGWKTPFRLEVNLRGYIKKRKDGGITRFWEADNQPTMISKVAEGQGLRTLWPDEFQGIYEAAEITTPTIDMSQIKNGSFRKDEPLDTSVFDKLTAEKGSEYSDDLKEYIELSAKANGKTIDEIKVLFADDFYDSWGNFFGWRNNKKKGAAPEKPAGNEDSADTQKAATSQGPQPDKPEPEKWNPYIQPIQQRYGKDKIEILKAAIDKKDMLYTTNTTGRELHEMLLKEPAHDCAEESETEQSATYKKTLDEREEKREAMYGGKGSDDDWDENAPQKMADDPRTAAETEALRQVCVDDLKKIALADRGIWMKSKQRVGLMTTPAMENLPIEKLIEWSTLARKMVKDQDIKF